MIGRDVSRFPFRQIWNFLGRSGFLHVHIQVGMKDSFHMADPDHKTKRPPTTLKRPTPPRHKDQRHRFRYHHRFCSFVVLGPWASLFSLFWRHALRTISQ